MTTALAIETWTLCWSAIRDEFSDRLRGLHLEPWWEHARLLRVMGCSHGYAWNIQQTYNERRGSNLLLSPLDWLLVEHYAFHDFPHLSILRGIHAMFDQRDRERQCNNYRQINSLAYCHQAVIEEARRIAETSVGCHYDYSDFEQRKRPHTLLLAVPPAGKFTFAAMRSQSQVERVMEIFGVGIIFTVYPDPWHRSEAQARYGVDLKFLDPEPANLFSGSRAGGSPHTHRSRQPFLQQQKNPHHGDTEARR